MERGAAAHRFGAVPLFPERPVRPQTTTTEVQRSLGERSSATRMAFQMSFADTGVPGEVEESPGGELSGVGDSGASAAGETGPAPGSPTGDEEVEARIPNPVLRWEDPVVGDLRMNRRAPARGGVALTPGEFGIMESSVRHPTTGAVGGISVRADETDVGSVLFPPAAGASPSAGSSFGSLYKVTVGFDVHFNWDTHDAGRTDVAGPLEPVVTGATRQEIVDDLTPPTSAPARPRRTKYWASDITRGHELFHAKDSGDAYSRAHSDQGAWLNEQSASSRTDAVNLGTQAVTRMVSDVNTHMGSGNSSPAELRAYARDAPLYQARADAVSGFRKARREERRERRRQKKEEKRADR